MPVNAPQGQAMEKEGRRQIMAELPIWQYDTLFLITVVLFGVTALTMQNLMSAAIVFGAYSFLICLIWTAMGAVDVAFTEAAVGAGVSTVFIRCHDLQHRRLHKPGSPCWL